MNAPVKLLFLILLIALGLRLPLVTFGMPFVINPDEANYISKILYLLKHFLNPDSSSIPGFFLYFNSLILFLSSHSFDTNAFINMLDTNPAGIYVPLRIVSLIFSLGAIIIVFLIGNLFSSLTGVVASGLFSVAFIHVMFSHIFLPFNMMAFFSLLATFFALKAYVSNNLNILKASAISASLSAGAHYIGVVAILPMLFVSALRKDFTKVKSHLVLFLILFVALNPYVIFYFPFLLIEVVRNYFLSYYYHHSGSYLLYLFGFLLLAVGPVAWTSCIFLLKYKKEYDLNLLKILFSLPIFCFAVLGLFHLTNVGYATILIPYFCVACGLVFNSIYNETSAYRQTVSVQWFLLLVLFLFAFYIPFKYTIKYSKLIRLSDTRALATEWTCKNTSGDYKIAWDKNSIQLNFYDPYNRKDLLAVVNEKDTLTNKQKFPITIGLLKKKNWLAYLKKKVDFVVINSLDYEKALRQPGSSPEKKYYARILKLKPHIIFNPYLLEKEKKIRSLLIEDLYMPLDSLWCRERTGPIIKIYKL